MTTPSERRQPDAVADNRVPADSGSDALQLTRKRFVERAAVLGGSAILMGAAAGFTEKAAAAVAGDHAAGALTTHEMSTLTALLGRLLPADELGPGAIEAGVPAYIRNALAGPYNALLPVYEHFLATLDQAAHSAGVRSFRELSAGKQEEILQQIEGGKASGVSSADRTAAARAFKLVLAHMREGMFCDPMYGGNKNLAGWRLIGFPGVHLVTTEQLQEINADVPRTGMTASSLGGVPFNGPDV